MNLTGHRGAGEVARRLILDAAALIRVLPGFQRLADLGSGAGFPGLPIAILFPRREVLSVEARSRRVSFQRTAVRELAIENVQILHGRIEELEPVPADAVIAQALAEPPLARNLMLPWVKPGGWLAIPGTRDSLARPLVAAPECTLGEIRPYRVPEAEIDRLVWLAEKRA